MNLILYKLEDDINNKFLNVNKVWKINDNANLYMLLVEWIFQLKWIIWIKYIYIKFIVIIKFELINSRILKFHKTKKLKCLNYFKNRYL